MKKIITAAVVSVSSILATSAFAGALDTIMQNTVVLTATINDQTITSNLVYQEDGTILVNGEATGSWEEKEGQLCTTLAGGPGGQSQTACSKLDDVASQTIGDSWTFSPAEGLSMTGELVAGR